MSIQLEGSWKLVAWRRVHDDGTMTYPFGEGATGILVYAADGRMAVQMTAAGRPRLATEDPLGGSLEERASAYSTCLAYFGTYELQGDSIAHRIEASLFPNWSGDEQIRQVTYDGNELVLRTPPIAGVVNEICWARAAAN